MENNTLRHRLLTLGIKNKVLAVKFKVSNPAICRALNGEQQMKSLAGKIENYISKLEAKCS